MHFPDLLAIREDGARVAFELELSVKGRRRLEGILLGYATEPRLARVVYVTDSRRVATVLEELVRNLRLTGRVEVRYFAVSAPGVRPMWLGSIRPREVER
jgi:hypothetical protein